jgi:hypothetical protein
MAPVNSRIDKRKLNNAELGSAPGRRNRERQLLRVRHSCDHNHCAADCFALCRLNRLRAGLTGVVVSSIMLKMFSSALVPADFCKGGFSFLLRLSSFPV